jgi:hypothetical protein
MSSIGLLPLQHLFRCCRATPRDIGCRFRALHGFDKNILTFNPGWDSNAQKKPAFTDVRDLQRQLKSAGVPIAVPADETTKGPASFVVFDPDGNQILVDQHV